MSLHIPKYPVHLHATVVLLLVVAASRVLWVSAVASAGALSNASVSLSDVQPAQGSVNYTFNFTVSNSTPLKSFRAQICTASTGNCVTPLGFSAASATLAGQPVGYGDSSGWVNDSVTGSLQIKNSTSVAAPTGSQQIVFSDVTNPSSDTTYFIRLSTYSDDSYATVVDSATVSFVVVAAVTVSLTIDPTLSFNVTGLPASAVYKGSLSTSNVCNDTATSVTFGSPLLPLSANTDYDCGQTLTTSTNADSGYQVTVKSLTPGDVLKNGTASIANWTGTNAAPTATPNSEAELFGYTTNDNRLVGVSTRFTSSDNLFAGLTDSDAEIAHSVTSVANDEVNIAYRLRFTVFSAAGTYTGKVVYTCTPTF
jgi:hypothetical protein